MLNPYSYAKYTGEQICEMYSKVYGLSTVTARFFNVYGDRQPTEGSYATVIGIFENQRKRNVPLTITSDGEQRRDFTHVKDIASGLRSLSVKKYSGNIFNLGTGKNYSINQLATMFKPTEKRYLPERPGEARETLADISEMSISTGWKPTMTLESYIENFLQSLTKNL